MLSRRAIRVLAEFDPIHGTREGLHEYDGRMPDYSPERVSDHMREVRLMGTELTALRRRPQSVDQKMDSALLSAVLENERAYWDSSYGDWWRRDPTLYASEAADAFYYLLRSDRRPAAERADAFLARLDRLDIFLEQGHRNAAHPGALMAGIAAEMASEAAGLLESGGQELAREAPKRARELRVKAGEGVKALRASAHRFRASADRRKVEVLGETTYRRRLQGSLLLEETPEEILRLAEDTLRDVAKELESLRTERRNGSLAAERDVRVLRITRRSILDYYRREIAGLRRWVVERKIASMPSDLGGVRVAEVPPFLADLTPVMSMEPAGAFDGTRDSHVYVQPIPERLTAAARKRYADIIRGRTLRWALAHETYPGHHLQIAMSIRHPSWIRRWHVDDVASEGWALYCEGMIQEEGLYDDPISRAGVLEALRFRACRAVVDVGLQTGRMSFAEAVHYLADKAGKSRDFAAREVKRYLTEPMDALTYLVGWAQFRTLREECRAAWGGEFTLRRFHDAVLVEGAVPIRLLREKILGRRSARGRRS